MTEIKMSSPLKFDIGFSSCCGYQKFNSCQRGGESTTCRLSGTKKSCQNPDSHVEYSVIQEESVK